MIYETKGLTLEQVDELYDEVSVARKSVGWTPTTTFREMRASVGGQGGVVGRHGVGKVVGEKEGTGLASGNEKTGEQMREYRAENDS